MKKFVYKKPQLQYWYAEQLNNIEATMSGGGGSVQTAGSVYLLNNEDGLSTIGDEGILGHAAIMIQKPQSSLFTLYNFGPSDNASPLHAGAVGQFADGDMSFSAFWSKCKKGGVWISNGVAANRLEGFDRYIKIRCSQNTCKKMRSYANSKKNNPEYYSAVSYNCLSFVIDVLSSGGVVIYSSSGYDLSTSLVPNSFFDAASSSSGGKLYAVQSL